MEFFCRNVEEISDLQRTRKLKKKYPNINPNFDKGAIHCPLEIILYKEVDFICIRPQF